MKHSRRLLVGMIFVTILFLGGFIAVSMARSRMSSSMYMPAIQKSNPVFHPTATTLPLAGTVTGTVLLKDGICCAGGIAGEPLELETAFTASSTSGQVTQMRVHNGGFCADRILLEEHPWELFVTQATYVYTPPINWSGFFVSAQFRDEYGNLSRIVCDDISVEGMPSQP